MIRTLTRSSPSLFLLFAVIGCSTAPDTDQGKADLETRAAASVNQAKASDPTLGPLLAEAAGYAVFPNIGKGGLIAGGAYGKGVLYENGRVVGPVSRGNQVSKGLDDFAGERLPNTPRNLRYAINLRTTQPAQ